MIGIPFLLFFTRFFKCDTHVLVYSNVFGVLRFLGGLNAPPESPRLPWVEDGPWRDTTVHISARAYSGNFEHDVAASERAHSI